jgi:hypothetical protein
LIKPPSFGPTAELLVASAMRNAKNAKLDPREGAIILVNALGDQLIPERALAIRNALDAAGIKNIQEVSFSKQAETGTKLLKERLKANPKVVLVFSVDSLSSTAGRQAVADIVVKRPFILAGYASEETYATSTQAGDFAAVAEYAPVRLVRKGITTATALARGRDVPSVYELPILFHDSPENATTAKSPVYAKKLSKDNEN